MSSTLRARLTAATRNTELTRRLAAVARPTIGLDGESPVIGTTDDDRDLLVVAWHQHSPLVLLPVVILRCFVCEVMVPAADMALDTISVSRVDGDSRYGYEAYHAACCN